MVRYARQSVAKGCERAVSRDSDVGGMPLKAVWQGCMNACSTVGRLRDGCITAPEDVVTWGVHVDETKSAKSDVAGMSGDSGTTTTSN